MRLAVAGVGAVLVAAVLAGCSDSEQASTTLPSTSSAAASPTTAVELLQPSDLPLSAAARERTAAGVEAFTDYYIALINHLQVDLDTKYLRFYSKNCVDCDRIAKDADSDKAAGYSYRGGSITLSSKGAAVLDERGGEIAFVVDQAPMEVLDSAGKPVPDLVFGQKSGLPGGLSAVWQKDHWVVSSLSFG